MSKSIISLLVGGVALLAILLVGCSDEPSPTPSAEAVPSPTVTAQPGVTPEPTPTPTTAPTNTPTPEPTPATATLSLDEYLTLCAPRDLELADDATYGDLSSVLAALADRFEALTPPAQLSEWQLLHIEAYRAAQAGVDTQPKDDVMVDNPTMNAVESAFVEKYREAAARVPRDVRQQMIEAHCIDPDSVPDDYADVPDGQGNDIDSATVAAATLSLDVYLTLCAPRDLELADDATYGDLSSVLAALADRFEALTPPAQLSEWQLLHIEAYRAAQAGVDTQSKDDVMVDNPTMNAVESAFVEKYREAAARVPRDVRQQMIEAHCIDPDSVPDDYADVPDGQGNDIDDATAAALGADVEGVIDYQGDSDYFRFTAEEGHLYQIDVALGSLPDSVLTLLGPDRWELAYNDDHGDSLASRVVWEAPASGDYYLVVEASGFDADVGAYTLTVSHSTIVDDHGNDIDDATVAAVGADVEGALDYDGDIDYFRFQAERGQSYQIDVALATLDDSIVDLFDADGSFLDSNDDYGTFASRLYWEAPSSGERYVAVEGYGVGTYTLTVSIVDDHGDTAEDGVGVASDRAALVALYNATEGGSWITRTTWLSGRPLDEWHGVTTDGGGRVTALNLGSNELTGPIPVALGDLTNLQSLWLGWNELTGPIPAALGDLSNLVELDLWGNDLTGPIPAELGDLANLEFLDLWANELTGPIPAALGDLTNLRALNLGSQGRGRLTGPIPAELGDLTNLVELNLRGNELTGPIPAALGDLTNLEFLWLGWNELTGPIPAALGDLANLRTLDLQVNQLTGPIPAWLGDLANLKLLYLGNNQLTGRIPAALGDLANLLALILRSNQLTGPIPAELSNLSNLVELYLSGNDLTGCVPVGLRDVAEENDLGELELPDCGLARIHRGRAFG